MWPLKWAGFFFSSHDVLKSEGTLKDFLVNIAIKTIKRLSFLNFLLKHKHLHKTVLKLGCGDHSVSHHSKHFPSTLKISRLFCYTGFFVALFICMMIHQRCLLCACEPVCAAGANRGWAALLIFDTLSFRLTVVWVNSQLTVTITNPAKWRGLDAFGCHASAAFSKLLHCSTGWPCSLT